MGVEVARVGVARGEEDVEEGVAAEGGAVEGGDGVDVGAEAAAGVGAGDGRGGCDVVIARRMMRLWC